MAAWTSRAAALMSRFKSNCRITVAEPTELEEVISVTPAMRVNCFSSGVAIEAAITSGLPPGRLALTLIVGKSIWGSGDTGNWVYASAPPIVMAIVSSVVAMGLSMKGDEMLMSAPGYVSSGNGV